MNETALFLQADLGRRANPILPARSMTSEGSRQIGPEAHQPLVSSKRGKVAIISRGLLRGGRLPSKLVTGVAPPNRRRATVKTRAHQPAAHDSPDDSAKPLPSVSAVAAIDSLDEICDWLGTFRERLRTAHETERPRVSALVEQLENRYIERRAELA